MSNVATNNFFIGRRNTLKGIEEDIFVLTPGTGSCHSIMGPNDIGKTELVRKWAERFKERKEAAGIENVYYFSLTLQGVKGYCEFWLSLFKKFSEEIPMEMLEALPKANALLLKRIKIGYERFNDDNWNANFLAGTEKEKMLCKSHILGYLDSIFDNYTALGIQIILTIDEFDLATKVFPIEQNDGSFFQKLFDLSQKGSGDVRNLTILLISRRRVGTIAHNMDEGSSFESAYPPEALGGFDDEEMEEYFDSFRELSMGVPDEELRRNITYFCGRHPGLLAKMRYILNNYSENSFGELYTQYGIPIRAIYNRMGTLLKSEFVDGERKTNCIDTYWQSFIGPAYDTNLKSKLDLLIGYGFATRSRNKSIYELAGMEKPTFYAACYNMEPISPYFVEFLKNTILPEEIDGLSRLLNQTELNVRKAIKQVMIKMYPENWEEVLEENTSSTKKVFRERLDLIAISNDADARNVTYTNLDVMAFGDYSKIIIKYWDDMRPYFQSYQDTEKLKEDFQFLADSRNCFAHLNKEILDSNSCKRLMELCEMLNQDFEDGENGITREQESTAVCTAAERIVSVPSEEEREKLINTTATFFCKEKTTRGGLRGILKENSYKASISPVKARELGNIVGSELSVTIVRWDENGATFNVEVIKTE